MGKFDLTETKLFELLSDQNQVQQLMEMNQKTQHFGLALTEEEAKLIVENKKESLKEQKRVEFGETILVKLIDTFCDSPYISQRDYADTLMRLQEIFYLYKNESLDELSDDELLEFMKKSFDSICRGSLEYLEETVLEEFARIIRCGERELLYEDNFFYEDTDYDD